MKFLTKFDIYIIIAVVLLAVLSYLALGIGISNDIPIAAEIMVDGKIYCRYNLSDIASHKIVEIDTKFGKNTLKITNNGAEMIDADCKDKLDIKCGKISKAGQIIICVPNHVSVRLVGSNANNVDKVTY